MAPKAVKFFWDALVARYREASGRFLARARVLGIVESSVDASRLATEELGRLAGGGALSPLDFGRRMKEEVRREYIRQYAAGRGGLDAMTKSDWGTIGGLLKKQYTHVDGFVADLEADKLSEAQAAVRAQMYSDSARQAYWRAETKIREPGEVAWMLDPGAENCSDCVALDSLGYQPAEPWPFKVRGQNAYPGSGATICLTNCRCMLNYRGKGE